MFITLLALGLVSTSLSANVKRIEPVSISKDLAVWQRAILKQAAVTKVNQGTGYIECAEITELKRAYFCIGDDKNTLNLAFGRLSILADGTVRGRAKQLASWDEAETTKATSTVSGHDILDVDWQAFKNEESKKCPQKKGYCLNKSEKELFEELIDPLLTDRQPFVILGYGLKNNKMDPFKIAGHEILHAQYYLQKEYRDTVLRFHKYHVSPDDRAFAQKTFEGFYSSEFTVFVNELQAYILMPGAEKSRLGPIVEKYRTQLTDDLKKAGVEPIQIIP